MQIKTVFLLYLSSALSGLSQVPSQLDPTFNGIGYNIHDMLIGGSTSKALAIQSDGKIICAGTGTPEFFYIDRFLVNGNLDSTFGINGRASASAPVFLTTYSVINDLIILPDGKIIAAGNYEPVSGDSDILLIRFKSNGVVDSTFGINGFLVYDLISGSDDNCTSAKIQSDGKIVVGGDYNNLINQDFFIVRFDSLGNPDSSFDFDGESLIDMGGVDFAGHIELQPDGRIIIAGSTLSSIYEFALARVNTNGSLDFTFSSDGKEIVSSVFGIEDKCTSLAVQPDGKILASGYYLDAMGNWYFATVRYYSNGIIDNTFGASGWKANYLTQLGYCEQHQILVQPDNKIVTGGFYDDGTGIFSAVIMRYLQDGTMDLTFDSDGIAFYNFAGYYHTLFDMKIQPDNKIIFTGVIMDSTSSYTSNYVARIYGTNFSLITKTESEKKFSIYPNPTTNYFTIEINSFSNFDDSVLLEIYSSSMQLLIKKNFNGPRLEIVKTDLSSGIYFIKIKSNLGFIANNKLVIEN